MQKFFSLLMIFVLMLALTGCGSEKNLGITAEEFQFAYNQEFKKLCEQDAAEISNFKVLVNPDEYFKIAGVDKNSGTFKMESMNPYFDLEFKIDETSSEKYLKLVTLEINEQIYRNVIGDDSAEKMKVADMVKKAFATAATQKKSSHEKIDELEKSGIRGQTELILKDNGIEFLYFAYNPGGKYFIASEDYAKTSEEFAMGENAVKGAEEVLEQQKLAEQKAKEQEEYYRQHPEELQKKLQAEKEEQERQQREQRQQEIASIYDRYFFEDPPKKIFPSDGKNHFAVYNRYECDFCGAHFYIGGYMHVNDYYDTGGLLGYEVPDNILMIVGVPINCPRGPVSADPSDTRKYHSWSLYEVHSYQDFGEGRWTRD